MSGVGIGDGGEGGWLMGGAEMDASWGRGWMMERAAGRSSVRMEGGEGKLGVCVCGVGEREQG